MNLNVEKYTYELSVVSYHIDTITSDVEVKGDGRDNVPICYFITMTSNPDDNITDKHLLYRVNRVLNSKAYGVVGFYGYINMKVVIYEYNKNLYQYINKAKGRTTHPLKVKLEIYIDLHYINNQIQIPVDYINRPQSPTNSNMNR